MSVAVGAQGVSLEHSMIFMGYETNFLENENLSGDITSGGELNFPWLIAISSAMGNAYTQGLSTTANVFSEPEWGFDCTGMNQNWQGAGSQSVVGAISIGWY